MPYTLLAALLVPALGFPFVYLAGKKSAKFAAIAMALLAIVDLALVLTTIPAVLNDAKHIYQRIVHLDSMWS